MICSCSYCLSCFNLLHEGVCPDRSEADKTIFNKNSTQSQLQSGKSDI